MFLSIKPLTIIYCGVLYLFDFTSVKSVEICERLFIILAYYSYYCLEKKTVHGLSIIVYVKAVKWETLK